MLVVESRQIPTHCNYRPAPDVAAPDVAAQDKVAANTAVVPVTPVQWQAPGVSSRARPDPSFVAHLLAMAASAPQTRTLRRADNDDAQTAYRFAADQNRTRATPGRRISQTA